MSNSNTPSTPDYSGAAQATANGNIDAARIATRANRIDTYTPTGSQTYTSGVGGDQDHWSTTQNLSPTQQALFDRGEDITGQTQNVTQDALTRVGQGINQGYDTSKLAGLVGNGQSVQDALMSRLAPQYATEKTAMESKLANQGIPMDSAAYKAAIGGLSQQQNDAYIQAGLQGIGTQNAARAQEFNEQTAQLAQPLNALNAVRTGSQVTVPTLSSGGNQATTAGADINGATNSAYGAALGNANVQNAQNNATTSAIGNALAAYLGS